MGIPVPTKADRRSDKLAPPPPPPPPPKPAYMRSATRMHIKRNDPPEYMEDLPPPPLLSNTYKDDFKRPLDAQKSSDGSRMGNYFNIVIAPPPIKALQPRKLLGNNFSQMKRLS